MSVCDLQELGRVRLSETSASRHWGVVLFSADRRTQSLAPADATERSTIPVDPDARGEAPHGRDPGSPAIDYRRSLRDLRLRAAHAKTRRFGRSMNRQPVPSRAQPFGCASHNPAASFLFLPLSTVVF